jgi:uncharacterized protein
VSTALVIFAKAPVPGLAKTRLAPALGAEGAAALAERLLAHAVAQALALPADRVNRIELCVTPSIDHPAFDRALAQAAAQVPGRLHLTLQGEGDLGARMHNAFVRVLAQHPQALLIGTDAPALNADRLAEAAEALKSRDAVFVPALDGGYALVGLSCPAPALFHDMPWSTAQVMALTAERAQALGLRWTRLAPVADIDEPTDLQHLPAHWRADLPSPLST